MPKLHTMNIVIDKNFLDGKKREEIENLRKRFNILMPYSIFYELMTTSAESRIKCFKKLVNEINPIIPINGIGSMLQYEVTHSKPCDPINHCAIDIKFNFNSKLIENDFVLDDKYKKIFHEQTKNEQFDLKSFNLRANELTYFFPNLISYKPGASTDIIQEIENQLKIEDKVLDIYEKIRHSSFPKSASINLNFTLAKWVQISFMGTLLYIKKYGLNAKQSNAKKLENMYFDIKHCITAAQVGGLATDDGELKELYNKVKRNGILIE